MTLKIRAHHVETARILYPFTKERVKKTLVNGEYIKEENHPFATLIEQYLALFSNPSQEFKLKIGGLDFICKRCPKRKRKACNPFKQEKRILGPAFYNGNENIKGRDSEIVEEYDLDINKTYIVEELKKIFKFLPQNL